MPVLQFKGKTAIETYHNTIPHHAFEIDEKLSVFAKGEKPTLNGNLIIEGDNLLALKALLPTHSGKIKCIYIDPPYNTGNEGWVYNDNLTQPQFKDWIGKVVGKEEEDACRHDKWCCMMYPRLQLLKELLREDGAIFVSIDDNEVANLRALMDEVFGEDNFVATIIWQKNFSPKNSAKWFSEDHDYVVVYALMKEKWKPILLERSEGQKLLYANPDDDSRGPWASGDLTARNPYSKGIYSIKCPGGRLIKGPPPGTYWRVEESKLWELHRDKRIWWGADRNGVPRLKRFLSEVKEGITPRTIWLHTHAGNTQEAKKALIEIVPVEENVFQTPKPPKLLTRILELATIEDDWILDSFAGSGTTAQAVLELNEEDGGKRRFILVQQPYDNTANEKHSFNICEKITAQRVRGLISGYKFEGTKAEVLLEEKVTLNTLKNSEGLLERIESAKLEAAKNFDGVDAKCEDGIVTVSGVKHITGKRAGVGGSFAYLRLSASPILGEYRDISKAPPSYEEIAKYVFYTETSSLWEKASLDKRTGKIGQHKGSSYYLLYTANKHQDQPLDSEFLTRVAAQDPNTRLVIYCEKLWVHRSELLAWQELHGKHVRTMIIPFSLK
jgi:adenine-specific DNA-methyltransferase